MQFLKRTQYAVHDNNNNIYSPKSGHEKGQVFINIHKFNKNSTQIQVYMLINI